MKSTDLLSRRLEAQAIAGTHHKKPEEVVAHLGAVQAQDYLGALWAVGLRLVDATERDVEEALAAGTIVRTWPMRGTLHFVAAADARWITELLAPKMVPSAASRLRALGLDDAVLTRARRALVKALEGGRRLARPDVYRVLERAKIAVAGTRGLHVLWRLAHDCLICFGPREGKQHTFVLFEEWLPRAKGLPRDEALAELARRYFVGHGPATLRDFVWWSHLKITDARRAITLAGKELEEDTFADEKVWWGASTRKAFPRAERAHLLPAFDEFLVGYADRAAAIDPAHRMRVNAGGGILNATIVVDGRVLGTWKRRIERREVVVRPALFTALTRSKAGAVRRALERYGRFLGLEARQEEEGEARARVVTR